jgi:RimJ/RimL family protein N-acetyltransferase
MLAALEDVLARDGIEELHLTVFMGNEPARRLYAAAGYEQLDRGERQCRLRKRLTRCPSQPPLTRGRAYPST